MFNNVFVKFKGTKGSFEIKCHYLRMNDIVLKYKKQGYEYLGYSVSNY